MNPHLTYSVPFLLSSVNVIVDVFYLVFISCAFAINVSFMSQDPMMGKEDLLAA